MNTDHRVTFGPVKGTDWCRLENADPEQLAPGGVVLCGEGSLIPHEDATRAAQSAWALQREWHAQRSRE
jgi:hypothetical protein